MAYYTIGGSLMHYRTPGSKNGISNTPGYRAIGQRAKGRLIDGRYVYEANSRPYGGSNASPSSRAKAANPARVSTSRPYGGSNASPSSRARTANPNARNALLSQLRGGVADDRRFSADRARSRQPSGNGVFNAPNNRSNTQRYADYARNMYNDAVTKARSAVEGASGSLRELKSGVVSAAKSTYTWGRKAIDWAGTEARKAFASVRNFISNVLKKVGAAAKSVSRWAETTAKNAYNNANTFLRNAGRAGRGAYDSARGAVASVKKNANAAYTNARNSANNVSTAVRKTGAKAFGPGPNNVADYYEKQARGAKKRRASSSYRPVR